MRPETSLFKAFEIFDHTAKSLILGVCDVLTTHSLR
jgi:hypothetical protein